MADEATEAPVQEQETPEVTPAAEAPETPDTPEAGTETTEPEVDYQKRYDDLRPQFDQQAQFLSALEGRQGEEAQRAAYAHLGLEVAEDEKPEEGEYVDPDQRLDQLEQQLRQRDEEAEEREFQAAEQSWIQQQLGDVAEKEGRDLTEQEKNIITNHALSNRFDDGQPDIEGGHELLNAIYKDAQKRLLSSKRNAPKPPSGAAGEPTIDTSTPEGRRAAIRDIAESVQEASD